MSNIGAGQPGSALSRHDLRGILFGAAVAMFLAALDQTIVAPALPAIARDLGEFNAISWLVTAYLLSSTAVTPIFGKLSDLYGRRRLLLAGLAIFIAGSDRLRARPQHGHPDHGPRLAGHRGRGADYLAQCHHRRCRPAAGARPLSGFLRLGLCAVEHCRAGAGRALHRASLLDPDLLDQCAAGLAGGLCQRPGAGAPAGGEPAASDRLPGLAAHRRGDGQLPAGRHLGRPSLSPGCRFPSPRCWWRPFCWASSSSCASAWRRSPSCRWRSWPIRRSA